MGREVRMVPKAWEHPRNEDGNFIPLCKGSYATRAAEWDFAREQWGKGLQEDWAGGWKARDGNALTIARYTDWAGPRPSPDDYMPEWPEEVATHLMMYEDTSEGTPISPAFATPEELARWLADNNASAFANDTATYEQWLSTCKRGWAVSAVMVAGGPMTSGVAGMDAFGSAKRDERAA